MTELERNEIPAEAREVLEFWFGPLSSDGTADAVHARRWWSKNPDFDREISKHFGALHEAVVRGEKDDWLESPRGRLALIIVLDQFSRNFSRRFEIVRLGCQSTRDCARGHRSRRRPLPRSG